MGGGQPSRASTYPGNRSNVAAGAGGGNTTGTNQANTNSQAVSNPALNTVPRGGYPGLRATNPRGPIMGASQPPTAAAARSNTHILGIFIIYLTACANDFARENKRQTITANDVLAAIKVCVYGSYIQLQFRRGGSIFWREGAWHRTLTAQSACRELFRNGLWLTRNEN